MQHGGSPTASAAAPRRDVLPMVVGAVLAALVFALAYWPSYRIGWAGKTFFEVAADLIAGDGFSDVRFKGATYFAPGYPALLALVAQVTGASLTAAAELLTLVGAVLTVIGAVVLYRQVGGRRGFWEWALVAFVVVSPQVLTLQELVLPEPLYLAACLWGLVLIERFAHRPGVLLGVGVVLVCSGAIWLRYAGIGLAVAGGLRLLLEPGIPWRRRLPLAVLPGLGFAALGGWLLVQISADNGSSPTTVTEKAFSPADVYNSVGSFGSHLVAGVGFNEDGVLVAAWADAAVRAMCIGAGAVAIVALFAATWIGRSPDETNPLAAVVAGLRQRGLLAIALYAVATIGILCVWRFRTGYMILPRYWTPVFLPLLAGTFAVASRHRLAPGWLDRAVRVAVVGVLALSAVMAARTMTQLRSDPPGHTDDLEMTLGAEPGAPTPPT